MIKLLKEIDFKDVLAADPSIEPFLVRAAKEEQQKINYNQFQIPDLKPPVLDTIVLVHGYSLNKSQESNKKFYGLLCKNFPDLFNQKLIQHWFGLNEQGLSNGWIFLQYYNLISAQQAKLKLNCTILNLQLKTYFLSEAQSLLQMTEETQINELPCQDLYSHYSDPKFRNQVGHLEGENYTLNWFSHFQKAFQSASDKIDLKAVQSCKWSPKGTFLIAVGKRGFQLVCGREMKTFEKFVHEGCKGVISSFDQKYLVSYNGSIDAPDFINFKVWEKLSKTMLRSFRASPNQDLASWKFNPDSSLLARLKTTHKQSVVSLFKLPEMQVLQELKQQNLRSYQWYSSDQLVLISYGLQSGQNINKIVSVNLSSKKETTWPLNKISADGLIKVKFDYALGIGLIALADSKRKTSNIFLKNYNLDMNLSEHINDKLVSVGHQLSSGLLAIVKIDPKTKENKSPKYEISIKKLQSKNKVKKNDKREFDLVNISTFSEKKCNEVAFTPNGLFFAMFNVTKSCVHKGTIQFGTIKQKQCKILKFANMPYMVHAQYDSSGRLFLTANQNSFLIWSPVGQILAKDFVSSKFKSIGFRPMDLLLSKEAMEQIKANYSKYKTKYEEEDSAYLKEMFEKLNKKKRDAQRQFNEYLSGRRRRWQNCLEKRRAVMGYDFDNPEKYSRMQIKVPL